MSGGKIITGLQQAVEMNEIIVAAEAVVQSITYDDSGRQGRGGNGGLISRDTIRRTDELRQVLLRLKAGGS